MARELGTRGGGQDIRRRKKQMEGKDKDRIEKERREED